MVPIHNNVALSVLLLEVALSVLLLGYFVPLASAQETIPGIGRRLQQHESLDTCAPFQDKRPENDRSVFLEIRFEHDPSKRHQTPWIKGAEVVELYNQLTVCDQEGAVRRIDNAKSYTNTAHSMLVVAIDDFSCNSCGTKHWKLFSDDDGLFLDASAAMSNRRVCNCRGPGRKEFSAALSEQLRLPTLQSVNQVPPPPREHWDPPRYISPVFVPEPDTISLPESPDEAAGGILSRASVVIPIMAFILPMALL